MSRPLSYADLPTRYGIVYERTPEGVAISIPPSRRWQFMLWTLAAPVLIACCFAFSFARSAMEQDLATAAGLARTLMALILISGIAAMLFYSVRRDFCRRTVIRVANGMLTIAADRSGDNFRAWPLSRILDIRSGPVPWNTPGTCSMGLHLHIRGMEFVEICEGEDAAVAEWLAETLRQALGMNDAVERIEQQPDRNVPGGI